MLLPTPENLLSSDQKSKKQILVAFIRQIYLYIIEIRKSFFDYKRKLQIESEIRHFWQGDRMVASPEKSFLFFD